MTTGKIAHPTWDPVMFNLAVPPGFRGLDPHKPVRVYQRHLPHWRQEGATYFVTFRLADALPQTQLRYLKRLREEWMQRHPEPRSSSDVEQLAGEMFRREEAWLDAGLGSCVFRDPLLSELLGDAILHFQGERHLVSSYVIMPNHCHLTIQPFSGRDLETILRGIKGVVARDVNAQSGRGGALWQQECYDRIVRDEEHLWRVIQYIGRNPFKAGLPRHQWRRWINPEWEALGWRFADEYATML